MDATEPIAPHGGRLVSRVAAADDRARLEARAARLPQVIVDDVGAADVTCIATGAYSPLEGFMGRADAARVLREARLADGLPWGVPITLAVDRDAARQGGRAGGLLLRDAGGQLRALLEVREVYTLEPALEQEGTFGTRDGAHPGVARLAGLPRWRVGGPITLLSSPAPAFPESRLDPATTRRIFRERGWRDVVGFQTRNPVHRAHEHLLRCALEIADGLFLQPLVGPALDTDVEASTRMACYRALLAGYFPPERTLLGVYPGAMRYAGPREALLHAIVRKNYGCTRFVVGRDHAGVGRHYPPLAAQRIFDRFEPGEIGIDVLRFQDAFHCRRCQGMASLKTCPHPEADRVHLSGTELRAMLQRGEIPPETFTRPEVARILLRRGRAHAG